MSRTRRAIAFALVLFPVLAHAQPAASFVIVPAEWDFGAIVQGDRVQTTITVTNQAAEVATITIVPTCTCLSAEPAFRVIPASSTATFRLGFNSIDDTGIVKRVFIFRSSAPGAKDQPYIVRGVARQVRPESSAVTSWTGTDQPTAGGGIDLIYYYTPGCRSCEQFLSVELPRIGKELSLTFRL